mgnify:CR=1 FL=1
MKVMLVNGSPHEKGTTNAALEAVCKSLNDEGIETEIYWLGKEPVQDCIGCAACVKLGKCVFDDMVNEFTAKAAECDGFVFGTPVYYAHPTGRIQDFLDRAFYSGSKAFAFKPAASVAVARRAGVITSFDTLNKYMTINQMPIVSSTYWNNVFGSNAEDTVQDEEGIQTMINIGKNMAWMMKCIEAGKAAGIDHPENEKKRTCFVR